MLIGLTGATGFLGRYLARRLAEAGHRLRCWYRPSSDRGSFEAIAAAVEWLPGTLRDAKATAKLVRGADAVVHAAVDWDGPRDRRREREESPLNFLHTNLMGSLALFQEAH